MRKLEAPPLDPSHQHLLDKLQRDVDNKPNLEAQVARADQLWKGKNSKTRKPTFDEIKRLLKEMSWPADDFRCHYCETSVPDEIEHIFPKTLFPDKCFDWDNYLYVCGNCNGPKNNKFAVIDAQGQLVHVTAGPVPDGRPAVINPRTEDPAQWIKLELLSGRFVPVSADTQSEEYRIADYVINTLINLNREPLPAARKTAFLNLFSAVISYSTTSASPAGKNHQRTISTHAQRSVWLEIVRQQPLGTAQIFLLFEELTEL